MYEFLKNNPGKKSVDLSSPERRALEIRRRMYKNLYASLEFGKEKPALIRRAIDSIVPVIPEVAEDISTELNALASYKEKDREDLLKKIVDTEIKLLAKHLSLEELERRMHEDMKKDGRRELSRGLFFNVVTMTHGTAIDLHIPTTFFESSRLAVQSITDGLKVLAKRVMSEEEFKKTNEIMGHSSLILEKPRFWTSLGFDIPLTSSGKLKPIVTMSREKLLEKYGPSIVND